jgi:hypothetical protein
MIAPLQGFGVALETVPHLMEQAGHLSISNAEALPL